MKRGALTAVVATALTLAAVPAAHGAAVSTHVAAESPAQVRAFWTPERMRDARPLDGPVAGGAAPLATPAADPPDQEIDPGLDTTYPYRIHGRLFVRLAGEQGECSATVITSLGRNVILTAGHCLALPGGGGTQFATNVLFVPAYRNGAMPFGSYPGTSIDVPALWASEGNLSLDAGVVTLAAGADGEIQDQLGSRGVAFNRPPRSFGGKAFEIFGYPAEPAAFYDGERPILCSSQFRGIESFSGALVAAPCNQQQGSSGGGWVLNGFVISLISHAGCRHTVGCQLISGTYLGSAVFKAWSAAGGLPAGRKKRIRRCKRLRGGRHMRCLSRAETFQPVIR